MKRSFFTDAHTHHLPEDEEVFACVDLSGKEELFSPEKSFLSYSFGIHPAETEKTCFAQWEEKAHKYHFLSAIGECGMDKHLAIDITKQKELFLLQASFAEKHNKALIIHCVKAWDLLYECASRFPQEKRRWLIHSFRGSPIMAKDLLRHGFFLSLAPQMVMHMSEEEGRQWEKLPFLLETDDKKQDIHFLYEKMAELCRRDVEEIKQKTWKQFQKIFDTVPEEQI